MARRRGSREGSIRRRSDGRWEGRLGWVSPDGRFHRRSVYARTRQEVQEKLAALRAQVQAGAFLQAGRQTLRQFLERWLEDVAGPSVRPRTLVRYTELLRLHVIPVLGGIPIQKLSPLHVQRLIKQKLGEGLSPSTVRQIRVVLRRALAQAQMWGFLSSNPAALVPGPKQEKYRPTPLAPEQCRLFLEACRGHRLEALFVLALTTGMREGELLGLTWKAIDLDRGVLRIEVQLQRIGRNPELVPPKSSKSRRTLMLSDRALEALKAHWRRQAEERLRAGPLWNNDLNVVFTTETGRPLDPSNLKRTFWSLLENAGLPKMRFHDLTHSTASFLLSEGVPLKVVSELLGHSHISLTADVYGHLAPQALGEVALKIDEILSDQ